MKRTKHLQQLMNYYLDEEIEHFRKNYEYNEENIDNHNNASSIELKITNSESENDEKGQISLEL